MDVPTARLDGEFWSQVDKQEGDLPGNQTAGLMIRSRHSQCETGRLPLPRSAAPPLLTYTPITNARSVSVQLSWFMFLMPECCDSFIF